MKRIIIMLICLFLLCGCSKKKEEPVIAEENQIEDKQEEAKETYDVDLYLYSASVTYAAICDILNYPDEYMGKKIRYNGYFRSFYNEQDDKYYYVCIVSDATACCLQGLEFILRDGEEYPDENENITVSGTLDIYEEYGEYYLYLRDAQAMSDE